MKHLNKNIIGISTAIGGVVLSFGIIYVLVFNLRAILGYSAVLTAPQNAFIKENPNVNDDGVYINGKKINESSEHWVVTLGNAKKYLRGVEKLVFSNESVPITIYLDLSTKRISNIMIGNGETGYGGDWANSGGRHCGSKEVMAPHAYFSDVSSDVSISRINFFPKKINLNGIISIQPSPIPRAPHFVCKDGQAIVNEGDPITLEVRNLQFDIDSEVIYRWSSKGGDTYEI